MQHMETMMSFQDSGGPGWYRSTMDHREVIGIGGGGPKGFGEMSGDHRRSCGDLFELVWHGGVGVGGRGGGGSVDQLQSSSLPLSPPEMLPDPPSEGEMAAWLYPIVRGEEPTGGGHDQPGSDDNGDDLMPVVDEHQVVPAKEPSSEKLRVTQERCSEENTGGESSERIRKPARAARRSHHTETHNLTEKRRRWKINERLKTLQELVPGCDKCNQASTLDQTIQYMKSLQQQVQAMSFGCSMKPASAAVAYPVVQPPYLPPPVVAAGLPPPPPAAVAPGMVARGRPGPVVLGPDPAMAPFVPMLPMIHHPAVMVNASPMLRYAAPVALNVAPLPAGKSTAACSRKSIK
ncbi:hypothetical protein ACP70R_032449 [Stipagrostis hirtigluma subsp. patula]